MSLWPVSSPCHSGGHWLLHDAGCNVLQYLDFPWCGPGLSCGLLPSLPTSPPGLAGEGFAGTQGWRELGCLLLGIVLQRIFLLVAIPHLLLRSWQLVAEASTCSLEFRGHCSHLPLQPACRGPGPSLVPYKGCCDQQEKAENTAWGQGC